MPSAECLEGFALNNVSTIKGLMDQLQPTTEHNRTMPERRAAKLEEVCGVRAMGSAGVMLTRGCKPRCEAAARQAGAVDWHAATGESDNQFLTRYAELVKKQQPLMLGWLELSSQGICTYQSKTESYIAADC